MSALVQNPLDPYELTPWGRLKPNANAAKQMAEGSSPERLWDFHHEVDAPRPEHGQVQWEPMNDRDKEKSRELFEQYKLRGYSDDRQMW